MTYSDVTRILNFFRHEGTDNWKAVTAQGFAELVVSNDRKIYTAFEAEAVAEKLIRNNAEFIKMMAKSLEV